MKKIFFILSALLLTTTVSSQALDGTWNGKLKVGGNSLTVVLNIDGNSCTLDSPDQGAKGIAAELLTKTEDSLSVRVPSIYASYEGKLQNDTLKGIFQQMGQRFPLTLTRGQHVVKRPQTPQPPFPYLTEEVTFSNESDGAVLSGTLTYPVGYTKEQRPTVVVMVSGSGLQNRDEEIFEHKPFAVIADYFARNGIATLRYD
ncbi:MAG: alpha/beta hydrolase, partial [Prevotella sp.]|nr:alpha/beta hydrolase [Prevotella sp.]